MSVERPSGVIVSGPVTGFTAQARAQILSSTRASESTRSAIRAGCFQAQQVRAAILRYWSMKERISGCGGRAPLRRKSRSDAGYRCPRAGAWSRLETLDFDGLEASAAGTGPVVDVGLGQPAAHGLLRDPYFIVDYSVTQVIAKFFKSRIGIYPSIRLLLKRITQLIPPVGAFDIGPSSRMYCYFQVAFTRTYPMLSRTRTVL